MIETLWRRPGDRAERAIAITRVALAAFCLFAIWLDPAEPARFAALTYTLLSTYVAYSCVLVVLMWRRSRFGWLPLFTHVVDIGAFSVLQYSTLGPSSPFFVYFTFALCSGAVRWGWRGALWTAPVVVISFLAMGIWMSRTLGPGEFELNRFVIRLVYLLMVAAALVYLGRHEARLRSNIERLAHWPAVGGMERAAGLGRILAHAGGIVGAERVTVVWELDPDASLCVAVWSASSFAASTRARESCTPIVPDPLTTATFMCAQRDGAASQIAVRDRVVSIDWSGLPVHPALLEFVAGASLLSAPFARDSGRGRVFFSGVDLPSDEALPLGEVVAKQVGASLDQVEIHDSVRQVAAGEERVRLARDLHDGVLQSLTGVRFELQSIVSRLDAEAPDGVRDRLLTMEHGLASEQRELRLFIESLKPPPRPPSAHVGLAAQLEAMRVRVMSDWNVPVVIRLYESGSASSTDIEEAIPRMINEAVVNAVKHGQPTRVSVDVARSESGTRVYVADDGRGFPFLGRYDHGQLMALNIGPVSLRDRVVSLGGELVVDSSRSGSRVEILLPIQAIRT